MDISSISTLNGYETAVDESSTSFYYSITDQDSTLKDTDIEMIEKTETPLKNVTKKFRNSLKLLSYSSSTPLKENLKDSSITQKNVTEISNIMEVDHSILMENDIKNETDNDTAKTVIDKSEKSNVDILITDCDDEKENLAIVIPLIEKSNLSVPVRHTRKLVSATVESLKKTVQTDAVKIKKTVTIAACHTMATRRRSVVSTNIQTTIKKISTLEEIQPTKRQSISTTFRQRGKTVLPSIIKSIKEEEDEPDQKRTRNTPVVSSKIPSMRKSVYKPVSVKTEVKTEILSSSENESKETVIEQKLSQKVRKPVVNSRKTIYKRKSGNLLIPAKTTVNAGKRKSFNSAETVSTKNSLQSRKSVIPSRVSRKTIFSSSPAPRSLRRSMYPLSTETSIPEKKSPPPQKTSRKSIFSASVGSKNVIPMAPVVVIPTSFTEPSIFKCNQCPKTFRLKSTFTTHVKSHELKKSSSDLSCKFCDKCFSIKTALDNHLMIHCTKISSLERRKLSSPSRLAENKSKSNVKNVSTAVSNHSVLYRTPNKAIVCRKCNLKFLDIIKYHEHVASHGKGAED